MSRYPLDIPGTGFFNKLAAQPYPPYPEGIFVSRSIFEKSMSPWTPISVAIIYLIVAKTANAKLKNRLAANKPPKDYVKASKVLSQIVLAHNAFLALFSGWTFLHAIVRVVPYFYNGVRQGGWQGFGNAYCTVPTDDPVGLGPFIWLFYMSKFYEIVDSLILIAKGKKVSNLQSYHHAGAIAAMWAGCRYSASAIWIFLAFNSGIHTLMYSYYTFSTLRLPFAGALKRSMTTAQITQLVVGCFIASLYLFVRYSPIAYTNGSLPSIGDLDGALSNISLYSSLRDALQNGAANNSDGDSFAAQLAKYAIGKLAQQQQLLQKSPSTASPSSTSFSPKTTTMLLRDGIMHAATNSDGMVSCCASTPQAFAVLLNVLYLLPLITLFVRFYLRSYSSKGGKAAGSKAAIKVEGKSQ